MIVISQNLRSSPVISLGTWKCFARFEMKRLRRLMCENMLASSVRHDEKVEESRAGETRESASCRVTFAVLGCGRSVVKMIFILRWTLTRRRRDRRWPGDRRQWQKEQQQRPRREEQLQTRSGHRFQRAQGPRWERCRWQMGRARQGRRESRGWAQQVSRQEQQGSRWFREQQRRRCCCSRGRQRRRMR